MAEATENTPEGKSLAEEKLEFAKQMLEGAVNGGNPETIKQYLDSMMMVYDVSSVSNGALIQADLLKGVFAEPQVKEHLEKMSKEQGEQAEKANIILKAQEEQAVKDAGQDKGDEKAPVADNKSADAKMAVADVKMTNDFGRYAPPANIPGEKAPAQGQQQGPRGGGR